MGDPQPRGRDTYTHVQGLTYEVVITTYTKSDALADRPFLFLRWGDETGNDLDSLARELPVGQLGGNVQVNTYRGTHTYGGPGVYELSVEDPNRNEGVLNMVGSVDTPFAIRSLLIIDPQAGHNNSVQLLNPATENACLNQPWIHNPAAHDPDGDVLTYSLVPCRGFNGDPFRHTFSGRRSPEEDDLPLTQRPGTYLDHPQGGRVQRGHPHRGVAACQRNAPQSGRSGARHPNRRATLRQPTA